jgi:hypothetical protein
MVDALVLTAVNRPESSLRLAALWGFMEETC